MSAETLFAKQVPFTGFQVVWIQRDTSHTHTDGGDLQPQARGAGHAEGPPGSLGARSAGGQPLRGQAWPAPGPRLPATRRERRDPASRSGAFAAAMLRIPETRNSPDVHPLMIDGKTVVSPRGGASLGRGRTLNTGRSGRDADAQGHAACDPVDVTRPGVSPTGGG